MHVSQQRQVIIIGGGLAGAAAAILLAREGVEVTVLEQRRYPFHKLCGEFFSPETQRLFESLGVLNKLSAAGAQPIDQVRLTSPRGLTVERSLPGTALGLSRFVVDQVLIEQARAEGAIVEEGVRVQRIAGALDSGFSLETNQGPYTASVVLGAYGKRGLLDRKLGRAFMARHEPYVAFKAHYEGVELPGVIEMHAFPGGYCGLSHVEAGRVNVCWIADEGLLKAAGGDADRMIAQSLCRNPVLADRFNRLRRVSPSFLAISQISFARKSLFDGEVCMIGDTAGLITPLCGDGMAMALQSAALASPLTVEFLQGEKTAQGLKAAYRQAWQAAFATRIRLGKVLHGGFSRPALAHSALRFLKRAPGLTDWMIEKTRG